MLGDRKRKTGHTVLLITLLILSELFAGCGSQEKAGMSELLPTVREENRLVLYTSHKPEVYQPIVEEFENQTGIYVEIRDGGTTELMEDIQNFGKGTVDVMFGGGAESYNAYQHCFDRYESSTSAKLNLPIAEEGGVWTPFSELPLVFIYNSRLVEENAAPKGWKQLLGDEKWKGQLAFADPGTSGTSVTILAAIPQILGEDPKICIPAFASQLDGKLCGGSADVVDSVENGTFRVGITLEETAKKRIAQGAPLAVIYPEDGTCIVPDATSIVNGAPHAANAGMFIDFTVSIPVQRLLQDQMYRRSVRRDLNAASPAEMKIVPFDYGWTAQHQDELMQIWADTQKAEREAADAVE